MFFFYATGITPAMTEKMVGQGSQYAAAFVDAKGNPLDGSNTYKLRMPPNIPAKDFWSFTVYDTQTRSMLQTDQQFPAVGSLTKGLLVNADGSVDVYFGPKAPAGRENNWCRPFRARAGAPSCVSTVRLSLGSIRLGGRESLSRCSKAAINDVRVLARRVTYRDAAIRPVLGAEVADPRLK